jgi:hypothetical protein
MLRVSPSLRLNTKFVMSASSLFIGVLGVALLFLPETALSLYTPTPERSGVFLAQFLGGAYLGYAIMDWMARHSTLGGIYGRFVLIGNFWHFMVGSLLALSECISSPTDTAAWILLAVYGPFGIVFALILYTPPRLNKTESSD